MNLLEEMEADGRTKVARCKCGKGVIMAARMPMAETEKDIVKEFRSCAKAGRRIEMMNREDEWAFCGCENEPKAQPVKAAEEAVIDPNQLALF